jgi:hypothetical protein
MFAARQTCRAAPVQGSVKRFGGSAIMWRSVYFTLGLLLARYLFRRRVERVDLDRLRRAGF